MSVYLKVDWKSGQFAEYSKEPQEGFSAYTNGNGDTRYQKIYEKGITASFQGVEMKDSNYGMQLVLSFKDGDEWINVQTPMLDQRDQITTYAQEFGRFLPNLNKGETYRVYPYFIPKDGDENKYDRRGISFKVGDKDGEKVLPALSWKADADEAIRIPRLDWKEDKMTGKKRPTAASVEAQRDFFADVFNREVERISGQEAVASAPQQKGDFGPPADADSDDDLPF